MSHIISSIPKSIYSAEDHEDIENMGRLYRLLMSVIVALISLAVALTAAELAMRYIFRDITTSSDDSSYFGQRWKKTTAHQNNSLGFREREIPPRSQDSAFRIALVGDSFTYGQGIEVVDRLSNRLETMLNSGSSDYAVFNFGKGGAETVDQIEFLKKYVFDNQPDFILLQWFINDVEGLDHEGRPQRLRLIPSDRLNQFLNSNSVLYYLINNQWRALQAQLGIGSDYTYTEYMIERFRDPSGEGAISSQKALDQFIELCRERRIPVGIIIFPELTGDYLDGEYALGFLLDRVIATCDKWEIQCVDLRPVFENVEPPRKLWVNIFDSHPGPFANKLAAQAVLSTYKPVWDALKTRN